MSSRILICKTYCSYYNSTLVRHVTQTIPQYNNKKSDLISIPTITANSTNLGQQGKVEADKTKRLEEKYEECEKLLKIKEAMSSYLLLKKIITNDETRKSVMQNITLKDTTQKLNESYMKTLVCILF